MSFSRISFEDLLDLVDIQEIMDYSVFDDWFRFDYSLNPEEETFLEDLLARNLRFVDTYLEEELKAQFIIPLLNKVNFFHGQARGWYERPLQARIEIMDLLEDSPSLKNELEQKIAKAYTRSRLMAENETGIDKSRFPAESPFSVEEILGQDFYPEGGECL